MPPSIPPPPAHDLHFTSLVSGNQNYEYFYFGLDHYFSILRQPHHFIYTSARMAISNGTINHLQKPRHLSSIASFLEGKKLGGWQEHDGTRGLTLNWWRHDCLPVNELFPSCLLQRINFPTKLDASGSFHSSPLGRSDLTVCPRGRSGLILICPLKLPRKQFTCSQTSLILIYWQNGCLAWKLLLFCET